MLVMPWLRLCLCLFSVLLVLRRITRRSLGRCSRMKGARPQTLKRGWTNLASEVAHDAGQSLVLKIWLGGSDAGAWSFVNLVCAVLVLCRGSPAALVRILIFHSASLSYGGGRVQKNGGGRRGRRQESEDRGSKLVKVPAVTIVCGSGCLKRQATMGNC